MDKENVYAYIEELDKRGLMEVLDAVINRFRELYHDQELIVLSLRKGELRDRELDSMIDMLKKTRDLEC